VTRSKNFVDIKSWVGNWEQIFMSATPYHSWERGLNEHTNGLLRQFFSKETNLKIVKPEQVERAVNLINNCPRKCLDYRTPFEVFYELSSDIDALHFWIGGSSGFCVETRSILIEYPQNSPKSLVQ
jgi:IS30 family transposase